MNEYSISEQAMRRGKLSNIHILIKMRALHWKKKTLTWCKELAQVIQIGNLKDSIVESF